jgi:hypothetical protein
MAFTLAEDVEIRRIYQKAASKILRVIGCGLPLTGLQGDNITVEIR